MALRLDGPYYRSRREGFFFLTFFISSLCFSCGNHQTEQNVISVAIQWGGPEKEAFEEVLDGFRKKHPEMKLQVRALASEEYNAWVVNQFAAGEPPDVFVTSAPGLMRDLAKRGQLAELSSLWSDFLKDGWFSESISSLSSVDKKYFGVPFKVAVKGLIWYQVKTLASAGGKLPASWEGLRKVLEEAKRKNILPFVVGGKDGWPLSEWFEQILIRAGDDDVFNGLWQGKIAFDHPAVKRTLTVWKELIENYYPEDPLAIGFVEAMHKRVDGEALFQLQGGWMNLMTKDYKPELVPEKDYSFFLLPPLQIPWDMTVIIGGDFILASKKSESKTGVMELLRYLGSPEAQSAWAKKGGFVASNLLVDESVYPDGNALKEARTLKQAKVVLFDLDDMMGPKLQRIFWETCQEFVRTKDVEGFIQKMQEAQTK